MRKTQALTPRQQEIFDLVVRTIEETGSPPTRAEIAAELGFKSANAAEEHLQALARKGVIELLGGTSRGIRLRSDTLQSLNASRGLGVMGQMALPGLAQLALPVIGRVAAGSPILAEAHVDQTLVVGAQLFSAKPDYLLKVKGLSMRDIGILDGDLLAVQKTQNVRNGQIVVARIDDEVTVKRLQRTSQLISLLPENPDFRPIEIRADYPGFEIEGLAVGLIRSGGMG